MYYGMKAIGNGYQQEDRMALMHLGHKPKIRRQHFINKTAQRRETLIL